MFNPNFEIYYMYLIKARFYSNKPLTPILYVNAYTDRDFAVKQRKLGYLPKSKHNIW